MYARKQLVKVLVIFVFLVCMCTPSPAKAQSCGATGLAVQVLGSGGPELQDKRASTSYLIWEHGKARVIVDAGGGSALRFGESGAQMSPVDVFLFSHFHVDHSGDFPALVFSSWFEDRKRPLPVFGPSGNEFMPCTTEFVHDLFSDPHGAWRYLSDMVEPVPKEATNCSRTMLRTAQRQFSCFAMRIWPVRSERGSWSVSRAGMASGDWRQADRLQRRYERGGGRPDTTGMNADIFVAHNAVPEGATGVERRLHMPPSVIGTIAANAHVKQLVLSHRMLRTLGKEDETQAEIKHRFSGPILFANDLDCFPVK